MSAPSATARVRLNRTDLRVPDEIEVHVGYLAPSGFLVGALLNCHSTADLQVCLEALGVNAVVVRSAISLRPPNAAETVAVVTASQVIESLRPDSDLQDDEYLVMGASPTVTEQHVRVLQADTRFR